MKGILQSMLHCCIALLPPPSFAAFFIFIPIFPARSSPIWAWIPTARWEWIKDFFLTDKVMTFWCTDMYKRRRFKLDCLFMSSSNCQRKQAEAVNCWSNKVGVLLTSKQRWQAAFMRLKVNFLWSINVRYNNAWEIIRKLKSFLIKALNFADFEFQKLWKLYDSLKILFKVSTQS